MSEELSPEEQQTIDEHLENVQLVDEDIAEDLETGNSDQIPPLPPDSGPLTL